MKTYISTTFLAGLCLSFVLWLPVQAQQKPNIILIMADDMGYSDIGCYGGEIPTPNIDKLAEKGVRFSQFYNVGRCCPTRASLLTGLQPHQAGVGHMGEDPEKQGVNDWGVHGYRGYLNRNSVTLAEVLQEAGYHTYMSGKWHVGMHGKEKWPLQRGFERFYGILSGGASHLQPYPPRGVTSDNGPEEYSFPAGFYDTDAFTDNAINFIKEQQDDKPFFLYMAHTAPHWPLQAKKEDYEQFVGKYMKGWDVVRQERFKKQLELGFIKNEWGLAQREMRPWTELTQQEKEEVDFRMAVYAAQVYNMDYNTGKLLDYLEQTGKLDNTLILFFSDNGACAEPYKELGGKPFAEVNDPFKFWAVSYGQGWANASNTPFKRFKVETYEGGIATPFIAYWPAGIKAQAGKWYDTPHHIIDIMPTFVELAGTKYPATFHNGNKIIPTEGISMVPAFKNGKGKQHEYLYWEHQNNCAIRWGKWKAVKKLEDKNWELYDMDKDRTEHHDLAGKHPDIVKKLDTEWYKWANSHHVLPKGEEVDPYK
ncbi:arylsulfatase [Botryobacter ruber]|uniref:arylsulfatase n=1 Tax=Botryobacter ruber TaxID=2171629 RepID=UPI000E0B63F4|nr:arylsulfatase [Botryobacter ruber]